MANTEITIAVTEFKANCLKLFKRMEQGKLQRVIVTRRGKPVAMVEPSRLKRKPLADAYGFMRGAIHLSPDYDPFERTIEEPAAAFGGKKKRGDAA